MKRLLVRIDKECIGDSCINYINKYKFNELLRESLSNGKPDFLYIDLTDIQYIDSSGLVVLFSLHSDNLLNVKNIRLIVNKKLGKKIKIFGFNSLFRIYIRS